MATNTGEYCGISNYMGPDKKLCIAFSDFLQNKYVAGFGDGTGGYKKALMEMGKVKRYDAFDGAPFSEKDSQGTVKHMDLTIPQFGLKLYDSVVSIDQFHVTAAIMVQRSIGVKNVNKTSLHL